MTDTHDHAPLAGSVAYFDQVLAVQRVGLSVRLTPDELAPLLAALKAARALMDGVQAPEDEFERLWIALEDAVAAVSFG